MTFMSTQALTSRRHFLRASFLGAAACSVPWGLPGVLAAGPEAASARFASRVALSAGDDRAELAFRGLKAFEKSIAAAIGNKRVIIKPNNVAIDNQLAASHAQNLEGILEFLKSIGKRDAAIAESAAAGPICAVLHAFSGGAAMAAKCLELGLMISFAGNATYTNKKFEPLRAAAAKIPADRILIETDCPYLSPEPYRNRQPRNEPAFVAHTAACLAGLRGVPVEQFAAETTANARRLFKL